MPTATIFWSDAAHEAALVPFVPELRRLLASELTCGDIALDPAEISVRLLRVTGAGMIGAVEMEVVAHAFAARVERQDEICVALRGLLEMRLPDADVQVWLLLCELGHSWSESRDGAAVRRS